MTRRMMTALLAATAMILAACGDDDDDGGGSTAEFCSLFAEESAIFSDESTEDEVIAGLQALADAAPSDIKGDVEELRDASIAISEIDFNEVDEDEFAALEEQFAGIEQAQANAEAWVLDNCDEVADDFFQS